MPAASKSALQLLQDVLGLAGRGFSRGMRLSRRRRRRILIANSIAAQLVVQGPWADSENAGCFSPVRCDLVERLANDHFLDLIERLADWDFHHELRYAGDTLRADPPCQQSHR